MKRRLLFALLGVLLLFIFFLFFYKIGEPKIFPSSTNKAEAPEEGPYLTPEPPQVSSNTDLKIAWIEVRDLDKLKLYSNLGEKLSSLVAQEKYQCDFLISASFYSKEGNHIGLFVADFSHLSKYQENPTFNGFFYIEGNLPFISYSSPQNSRIAVQSGPVVFFDNKPVALTLKNNENARRVVAAVSESNVYFITFYFSGNDFSGPKLAELPELLLNLKKDRGLKFESAINLDGGNHSVFLTQTEKLTESSKAGGFFCIKP